MLKFLLEKEFKQILRDSFLPRMIIGYPIMTLLLFPLAANFEIKNINLSVIDNDHSVYSTQLVEKVTSSGYFRLTEATPSTSKALKSVETDQSDIILEIPADFEKDLLRNQTPQVLISSNAVNGSKSGLGSAYLTSVISRFSEEIRDRKLNQSAISPVPTMEIVPQYKFNPHLKYTIFMVPALMVMALTMLCGFLPALNIVSEKENGTMEQINVTPITRTLFIVSKLIPYWIMGFLVLTVSFGLAYLIYGLVPVGSLLTIYFFASIFILGISGMGLLISNYSDTMQQAMFVIFFFLLIMILLSGLFTPIENMPQWAQYITDFNPLKYFMQVMRSVYLKGSQAFELTHQLLAMSVFAIVFNVWAVWSYRKSG